MKQFISLLIMGALIVPGALYASEHLILLEVQKKEQEPVVLYQSLSEREGISTTVAKTPVECTCVLCTMCLFENLPAKHRVSRIILLRKSMHPT